MINGHGDDSYTYQRKMVSNFSSNAYSGLDLSGLKSYLVERMEVISLYPEPEAYSLEKHLAEKLNLQTGEVCVTNGATEAIYLIAQAFKGSVSGICMPTFSEYADACCIHGHRTCSLYDLKEWNKDIQLIWLCNPNNPTGEVRNKEILSELIYRHPNTYFIIDQAYEDFTLEPLFTAAEAISFSNVVLLHSMTKRFSIPGLRLGYITAPENLLTHIRTQRMPWSVNALAIEAGMYFLKHSDDYPIDLSAYLQETARLSSALSSLGYLEVWPTDTHYMLVRLRMGKASALKDYLANEHGMLIRDASNFEGLDEGFFRIAVQTPAENDALVDAISQWIENG
ncbi:threonine-phosphate decarboxylase [uncultured Bacteroides sp.]|uniref:threonine-phosphate decarboxylase n=1 Tax=uncultured Bacteroides sp. TaxID=162156 RepID=UPI002AAC1427|nr:threonine-phosphate decarboxylase [uncultured Bacteroides sp.]